jgi:hypothetical protein
MKALGFVLVILGIICIAIPSVTFFTQERVADAGFIHIDVQKPHTIVLNPIVGAVAAIAGVALLAFAPRRV